MSFAIDSSCIVAALCEWHEAHEQVFDALNKAIARAQVVIPAHALVESYAVLTRLPPPHRLTAETAVNALSTLKENAHLAALPALAYWNFIGRVAEKRIAGGTSYDALILETARHAKVDAFWSLNTSHFARLNPAPIELVNPLHL